MATEKKLVDDQWAEFAAATFRGLPRRFPESAIQRVIEDPPVVARALTQYLLPGEATTTEGGLVISITNPLAPLTRDMRKEERWKKVADSRPEAGDYLVELVEFLKPDESSISGFEMVDRGVELGANAGQLPAEILLAKAEAIPKEMRKFVLIFQETVWQGSDGYLDVPFLFWDGDEWCLRFGWLGRGFDSSCRLVRLRKK